MIKKYNSNKNILEEIKREIKYSDLPNKNEAMNIAHKIRYAKNEREIERLVEEIKKKTQRVSDKKANSYSINSSSFNSSNELTGDEVLAIIVVVIIAVIYCAISSFFGFILVHQKMK